MAVATSAAGAVDWEQDWRAQGSCSGTDPNLWFSPGAIEHREAKKICRGCPVQLECLSYAMDAPVDHGVWGGMTERERRRHRRRAGHEGWRAVVLTSREA